MLSLNNEVYDACTANPKIGFLEFVKWINCHCCTENAVVNCALLSDIRGRMVGAGGMMWMWFNILFFVR